MPLDAMLRHYLNAILLLVLLGRCPGKVVTADLLYVSNRSNIKSKVCATYLDVVVGEFAVLVVIHTQKLSL